VTKDVFIAGLGPVPTDIPPYLPEANRTRDLEVADELVSSFLWFLGTSHWDQQERAEKFRIEKDLVARITSQPDFNEQVFIDDVIVSLESNIEPNFKYSDFLIRSLMQTFYNRGQSIFMVDYRRLRNTNWNGKEFSLVGKRKRPLSVHYRLPKTGQAGRYLGTWVKHCRISYEGDDATYVGVQARHSSFDLENPPRQLGIQAKKCTFYLRGVEEVISWTTHCGSEGKPFQYSLTYNHKSKGASKTSTREDFFRRENRIMIPDGAWDWKEVLPP